MPRYRLKAVLFDLDGTLLDTAPDLGRALNQILVHHGKKPVSLDKVRQVASYGSPGLLKMAFGIDTIDPDYIPLRDEFLQNYCLHIADETVLYPGMDQVLTEIQQHDMAWGVVTNKNHAYSHTILEALGLLDQCAVLVGGDTTPHRKPHPAPILEACKQLNIQPDEAVYIGDAPHDIEAAQACDMLTIAAMYGYLAESAKPEHWNADHYIDKPAELIDWITKCTKPKCSA